MTDVAAYGTQLKLGDGASPEVFTVIAQVTSIGGPNLEMDALDVTAHDSTAGWREFIGGLLSGGEVSLEINYDPVGGTHDASTGLIAELEGRTISNYQLVFPDAATTTWEFTALVTRFSPSAPVADKLTASITLQVSGQPTLV